MERHPKMLFEVARLRLLEQHHVPRACRRGQRSVAVGNGGGLDRWTILRQGDMRERLGIDALLEGEAAYDLMEARTGRDRKNYATVRGHEGSS